VALGAQARTSLPLRLDERVSGWRRCRVLRPNTPRQWTGGWASPATLGTTSSREAVNSMKFDTVSREALKAWLSDEVVLLYV
jgi:hypothetical protein